MAVGASAALCNSFLNALGNNTAYSVTLPYIKLHVGDPGAAGTSNAATETTRKSISFGASSAGIILNDVAVTWTNIAGSQDATHFTIWDDITAGNFLASGTITANAYTAGDTYTIAIGGLSVSLTVAS
jgi:phage gp29-like protein